ncbi:SDR family NAD(P)-dependent oxidoreductase [Pseudomonas fluorescens]|uniref:SDR family NAD(P)-dependent oxidoreductase n=1 Tax=Pseudomonas fluorescens TaxID=294 RepID=UPI0009B8FF96|nr:SDR family NAD(P)-dependent oxidoreductase [Pseudomonas fluorescens]
MKIDLSGKTAIVTGSTEGIGFAIAKGLSQAGATVIVNGRSAEKVQLAVSSLGGTTRGVVADLADKGGVAVLLEAVPSSD